MEPHEAEGSLDGALEALFDPERGYNAIKEDLCDRFTRLYLRILLERTGHNKTRAARMAGLDRSYFGRLLHKYGMAGPSDRPSSIPPAPVTRPITM